MEIWTKTSDASYSSYYDSTILKVTELTSGQLIIHSYVEYYLNYTYYTSSHYHQYYLMRFDANGNYQAVLDYNSQMHDLASTPDGDFLALTTGGTIVKYSSNFIQIWSSTFDIGTSKTTYAMETDENYLWITGDLSNTSRDAFVIKSDFKL